MLETFIFSTQDLRICCVSICDIYFIYGFNQQSNSSALFLFTDLCWYDFDSSFYFNQCNLKRREIIFMSIQLHYSE